MKDEPLRLHHLAMDEGAPHVGAGLELHGIVKDAAGPEIELDDAVRRLETQASTRVLA